MNAWIMILALAQDPTKPVLTAGVSVQMAQSKYAKAMPAADALDAKVVAITASGKVYLGVTAVEPDALSALKAEVVYVKADARAPYQRVLNVLDALRGKAVAMLTSAPADAPKAAILPPYGVRLGTQPIE